MGRHMIINPKTNRAVLKTGKLGREIQKKKQGPKKSVEKQKQQTRCTSGKCGSKTAKPYAAKHSTKRPSPAVKAHKGWWRRPSARYLYDEGLPVGYVIYHGGYYHALAQRDNGSPYWKKLRPAEF